MHPIRHHGQEDRRGLSKRLWDDTQWPLLRLDPDYGWCYYSDFGCGPDFDTTNEWTLTQATTGTWAADETVEAGVGKLDSGSTTGGQGAQIQRKVLAFKPQTGHIIKYESRLKVSGISNLNVEFFAGLAEIDTTVIASSAVSTANHIAFTSVTDDGVLLGNAEKAGTGTTKSGMKTLADDTYVKLGFKVTGTSKIEWYVDGVPQASTYNITSTNIPVVVLFPTFVCQSGGTDQPILHVDWACAAQHVEAA